MAGVRLIVVGKRAIEGVLPWGKFHRNVIAPAGGIGVVKTTVVFGPIFIPGARAIGHGIISARLLADPIDRCHDTFFPWITLPRVRPIRRHMPRREGSGVGLAPKIVAYS